MKQDEDRIHELLDQHDGYSVAVLADVTRLMLTPRPLADYHEDHGPALWWKFPINEPPYVGTPLDDDWPDYHTHWTPIVCPKEPTT